MDLHIFPPNLGPSIERAIKATQERIACPAHECIVDYRSFGSEKLFSGTP